MNPTMNALQFAGVGKPRIVETFVPSPARGEILLKVEAVTTCPQWDLHIMAGEPMFPGASVDYPYTLGQPGHEATGRIAAVGPDVETIAVGDRVVVWRDRGHSQLGAYAQYTVCPAEDVLRVPEGLPAKALAPLELAMCVQVTFDELLQANLVDDARFAVAGLGPAGLVAVQMARAYGAREVIGIDPVDERRSLACTVGATAGLSPSDATTVPPNRYAPAAFDTSVDCTGIPESVEHLMARTRSAVAVFGVLRSTVRYGFEHWTGLKLFGYGQHNKGAAERALQLVLDGGVDLTPLSTRILPLSRYAEGIELLKDRKEIKICFLPWD